MTRAAETRRKPRFLPVVAAVTLVLAAGALYLTRPLDDSERVTSPRATDTRPDANQRGTTPDATRSSVADSPRKPASSVARPEKKPDTRSRAPETSDPVQRTERAIVTTGDGGGGSGASASSLVAAAIRGDHAQVQRLAGELRQQQPERGERKIARKLNAQGLALFESGNHREAAAIFRKARLADSGDVEVRENLGYALLRSGELAQAERALLATLELGPQRATAWGSLGHVYAKRGEHREAVALLLTAYRFAPDRQRALDVYARQAEIDNDPKVRAMLTESVQRLAGLQ